MQLTACFLPSAEDTLLPLPPSCPLLSFQPSWAKHLPVCQHGSLFRIWTCLEASHPTQNTRPRSSLLSFPNVLRPILFRVAPAVVT